MYPDGIRHIRADKRVNEWKAPGKKTIVKCAVNQRQVVIALTAGELVYFEMDPVIYFALNYVVEFFSADDTLRKDPVEQILRPCSDFTILNPR